jgi:hypothetical protein
MSGSDGGWSMGACPAVPTVTPAVGSSGRTIDAAAYCAGIADGERRATAAIVAWLLQGSVWLNGGECCGAKDSDGVCCAPACEWGEELKLLHKLADAIERGDHLPSAGCG